LIFLTAVSLNSFAQKPQKITGEGITNQLYRYKKFRSQYVGKRIFDVWLPFDYSKDKKYAVIYMHDGQNLFDSALAFNNVDWGVDETLQRLLNEGKVRDAIVVGIWNTDGRPKEFSPEKAFNENNTDASKYKMPPGTGSDNYLKFIVEELKPFIDSKYSTLPDRENTFMIGSSMGALMSLYAISEYPDIFGGVGCMSSHFTLGDGVMVDYMEKHLPSPQNHIIYFDYGTIDLDKDYDKYQERADKIMQKKGYKDKKNWRTMHFQGDGHNEYYWRRRVNVPLEFLLKKPEREL
jgi:predicted alpha/beta superfamily hydrolase